MEGVEMKKNASKKKNPEAKKKARRTVCQSKS